MLEKELSFADLSISLSELYEAMGYADAVPDEAVEKEVRGVLGRVEAVTSPRFCFFISGGELDESKDEGRKEERKNTDLDIDGLTRHTSHYAGPDGTPHASRNTS